MEGGCKAAPDELGSTAMKARRTCEGRICPRRHPRAAACEGTTEQGGVAVEVSGQRSSATAKGGDWTSGEMMDEHEVDLGTGYSEDETKGGTNRKNDKKSYNNKKKNKNKIKERNMIQAMKKRGVCYLSRIPRHMDHVKLRHILSQYGEIERIYLVPENPSAQVNRKRAGGYRGIEFSEGWVEFVKKGVAKKVAELLNGEQIGGQKRSSFYYDIWNIKYLRKFKWDDLTSEIAEKNAIREQKLALEISAAKRERDFYLSKVDMAHALSSMEERAKKKQKVEAAEPDAEEPDEKPEPKIIRRFPQNRPVKTVETKTGMSRDILAAVFGRSSS